MMGDGKADTTAERRGIADTNDSRDGTRGHHPAQVRRSNRLERGSALYRACSYCRWLKIKCVFESGQDACQRCQLNGKQCSSTQPSLNITPSASTTSKATNKPLLLVSNLSIALGHLPRAGAYDGSQSASSRTEIHAPQRLATVNTSPIPRTKAYICPLSSCGRLYRQPKYLKQHLRFHTAYKPYQCERCFKQFSRTDYLTRHHQTHVRADTGDLYASTDLEQADEEEEMLMGDNIREVEVRGEVEDFIGEPGQLRMLGGGTIHPCSGADQSNIANHVDDYSNPSTHLPPDDTLYLRAPNHYLDYSHLGALGSRRSTAPSPPHHPMTTALWASPSGPDEAGAAIAAPPMDHERDATSYTTFIKTIPLGARSSCSNELQRQTVINSLMTPIDIINVLKNHGCVDLTSQLEPGKCSSYAISTGGFGDIYSGQLVTGTRVAIKVFRFHLVRERYGKHLKHAAKELHTWSKCQHPNVLGLLGLVEFQGQIGMVSPWMNQGNLRAYIDQRPDVDRYHLCYSICEGLTYLHSIGIVHGDLKGANVLVSDDGTPVLTDFGNSILTDQSLQFTNTVASSAMSPRWTAPELLDGSVSSSYAADVFSLGMTLLETITGNVPFHELKRDSAVMAAMLIKKGTPARPEAELPGYSLFHDAIWNLLTCCWTYEPKDRPSARQVRDKMQRILNLPINPDDPSTNMTVETSAVNENTPTWMRMDSERNATPKRMEASLPPRRDRGGSIPMHPLGVGYGQDGFNQAAILASLNSHRDCGGSSSSERPNHHRLGSLESRMPGGNDVAPMASSNQGKRAAKYTTDRSELYPEDMGRALSSLWDSLPWDTQMGLLQGTSANPAAAEGSSSLVYMRGPTHA